MGWKRFQILIKCKYSDNSSLLVILLLQKETNLRSVQFEFNKHED